MASHSTTQIGWIAPYRALLLRRGWFVVFSVLVSAISTLYIPDIATPPTYQATLHIQAPLASAFNTGKGQDGAAAFYTHLFINPTTLALILPRHRGWQLSDLRSHVTAAPLADANVVELSAIDLSSQQAISLVADVFDAVLSEISQQRSALVKQLIS